MKIKQKSIITILSALIVAILFFTTMTVSIFAANKSSDAYKWTKPTKDNPLGGAAEFNAFIFDSVKSLGDIEGNAAIGGDIESIYSITYPVGRKIPSWEQDKLNLGALCGEVPVFPKHDIGLLKTKDTSVHVENGSIVTVGKNYFDEAYQDLKKLSNDLLAQQKNSSYTYDDESHTKIRFKSDLTSGTAVFSINGNELAQITEWNFDVDRNVSILINVHSSSEVSINMGKHEWSDATKSTLKTKSCCIAHFTQNIFWNFSSEVKHIKQIGGNQMRGSVLAVDALYEFIGNGAGLNGQIAANSLKGINSSEVHYYMYRGKFPPLTPPVSSDTSSEITSSEVTSSSPSSEITSSEVTSSSPSSEITSSEVTSSSPSSEITSSEVTSSSPSSVITSSEVTSSSPSSEITSSEVTSSSPSSEITSSEVTSSSPSSITSSTTSSKVSSSPTYYPPSPPVANTSSTYIQASLVESEKETVAVSTPEITKQPQTGDNIINKFILIVFGFIITLLACVLVYAKIMKEKVKKDLRITKI